MNTVSAAFAAKKEKKRRAALKERHFSMAELDRVVRSSAIGDSALTPCTSMLINLSYVEDGKIADAELINNLAHFIGSMTELLRYISARPQKYVFSDIENFKNEHPDHELKLKVLRELVERAGCLWLGANLRSYNDGNFETICLEEKELEVLRSAILRFCDILPFIDTGIWNCVTARAKERWELVSSGTVDEDFNFVN